MSSNTPKSGLTYPALADAPNVPANLQTLASQLDGIVIPKYATATAMNTANASPTAGDLCYRTDLTSYMSWDGTQWVQLAPVGVWQQWTPTWGTTTGLHLPSYGNAVVKCWYQKVGKTLNYSCGITFGSTTVFGSGAGTGDNWTFSLPSGITVADASLSGGIAAYDPGNNNGVALMTQFSDTTHFQFGIMGMTAVGTVVNNAGVVDSVSPFTWASGDRLYWSGSVPTTT